MEFRERITQTIKNELAVETIDQAVETERFETLIRDVKQRYPELASQIEDEFVHAVSHTVNYIITSLVEVKIAIANKQEINNSA